ncbi:MAG: DUF99 family protein [Candidatus Thermoplasmatota archaeon]|jgi:endonuclease V-like protein UPF0215 family|nr:DUF99 family protein [Candidatus Thermoplasmatota archaeon]
MKQQIRLLGVDDSPFSFTDKYVTIVGAIMRGGEYLECVLSRQISVDGDDATFACIDMIKKTKHRKQLKATLLDGVTFGGFNVVDVQEVFNSTGLPLITVTRDKPDFNKIKKALKNNFSDWENRLNLIKKGRLYIVKTRYNPIFVKCTGINIEDAKEIIKLSTIRGVVPEPIRVAHLIASGIARGESYGKA